MTHAGRYGDIVYSSIGEVVETTRLTASEISELLHEDAQAEAETRRLQVSA